MNAMCNQYEDKMKKSVEVMKQEFQTIRAGRANPSVLNKIVVSYYGSDMPINQLAAIASPEPRMLTIQPWDAGALKAIEKAIIASDLGINPQNDGTAIRLIFPPMTEERRRDLSKDISRLAEECKVAIRSIRRDAIDKLKDMKKKSEITEDDLKSAEKKMQDQTDRFTKEADKMAGDKEKEIMEI